MPDGRIDRVVMEHVDPSKRGFIEEYDRRYPLDPDSPVGSPKVIRTGEPELLSDIPDEFWDAVAQDPEQHRLMREVGIVSALVVPMRVRGTVIGDIALAHSVSGRRYTAEDLPRAQDLADRCALAIDNARLHTAARRSRDDLEAIVEGVADAVTAQSADGRLVYANDAAVRLLGLRRRRRSCCPPRRPSSSPASRCPPRTAATIPLDRAAGPPRAGRRAPAAADGALPPPDERRGPLVAHPVDARVRRGRPRAARDQRDRGHHRHQARRAGPPLPGPRQPGARELARLPGDAARRGPARRPGGGGLVRGRRAGGRRARARGGRARRSRRGWRWRARCRSAIRPTRARTPAPGACCGADAPSSTARSRTSCSCRRRSTRSTWS